MKKYLVGGAVRDSLLGLAPKDRDWVVVHARGDDIESMLKEGFTQVGADFPVFLHPETGEEYALARIERKTGAGYHGFSVEFDSSVTIEEDLARRDLTINSMAMDDDGNVIDPFGGRKDLNNHVLRHTTGAFAEDPLRVLRLARFAARMPNWTVHYDTIDLCRQIAEAGELNALSIERIWTEMEKGFNETSPLRFMQVLTETGALKHCVVLRDLFGMRVTSAQASACRALQIIVKEDRLAVAVGVLARFDSTLPGANNRTRDVHTNVSRLWHSATTAEALSKLLKQAKALQEGATFHDFVQAVLAIEYAGFRPPFSSTRLRLGADLMNQVRAIQFPGLEGKALGLAIDAKRVESLQMAMSIPKSEVQQQQG